jgi:uncharacterized protein
MTSFYREKWSLVTGASSGIGREFAHQLAAHGSHLVLTARSTDLLHDLAHELTSQFRITAHVLVSDLTRANAAQNLAQQVQESCPPISLLVNNAGFGLTGKFESASTEQLADMVRLNCEALTVLSREFLPALKQTPDGGMINVASVAGFQPLPYMATYAASKAYVVHFSAAIAEEVRPFGTRVLALCPGPVPTNFQSVAGIKLGPLSRIATVTSEQCVQQALSAYEKGKTICIPGTVNHLQSLITTKLPRQLLVRTMGELMTRMGRANRLFPIRTILEPGDDCELVPVPTRNWSHSLSTSPAIPDRCRRIEIPET